jgi:hypothetical protein
MSADLRKYFLEAQEEANDSFFNYDGYDYFDDYDDFDDDYFEGDDDFDMASGSSAPTSQPYIVVIKNTATATAYPVTILGAYNTLKYNSATTPHNWQNSASISITMGISGITYAEFLYQSMNKPFVCGLTYYQASGTNAEAQILETLTLISRDVNGNETQKTLVPTIDPYQQQNSVIAIKFSYKIDGFTSIVISSVLQNTTAKLYFYPAETSSVSRTLTGRRAVAGYGSPHIIKQDKLTLSNSAIRKLKGRRRRR